ncbi:MAG: PEP-CTERM sorting domain-containing protein [Acidobacteria bacterium]|nr:PEP-CTERM sorting domain-containing protein [Acidobacteriota bacterium]
MKRTKKRLFLFAALTGALPAADFSFYLTLRAGLPFFPGAGAQEIRIGPAAVAGGAAGAQFNYGGVTQWWREGGLAQDFQIGYVAATNTGFVSVFNSANNPTTVTFSNPSTAIPATSTWTIPAANFFVSAAGFGGANESVSVSNLSFSPGVAILSGALPSTLSASSPSGPATGSAPGAIVFNPAASGGNWTLSGQIRFSGLILGGGGFAFGDALRFDFGATGADPNPEPGTVLLLSVGLAGVYGYARRRAAGVRE